MEDPIFHWSTSLRKLVQNLPSASEPYTEEHRYLIPDKTKYNGALIYYSPM